MAQTGGELGKDRPNEILPRQPIAALEREPLPGPPPRMENPNDSPTEKDQRLLEKDAAVVNSLAVDTATLQQGGPKALALAELKMNERLRAPRIKNGKLLYDPEKARFVAIRARTAKDPQNFRLDIGGDLKSLKLKRRLELGIVLKGAAPNLGDPKSEEKMRDEVAAVLSDPLLKNFSETCDPDLVVSQTLVAKYKLPVSPGKFKAMILDNLASESEDAFLNTAINKDLFVNQLIKASLENSTLTDEELLTQVIAQDPELAKQYEEYQKQWSREEVTQAYAQVDAPTSRPPTSDEVTNFASAVGATGVELTVSGGAAGEVHFGSFERDATIVIVDDKPQVVFLDPDADNGLRGPYQPGELRAAVRETMIDNYVSKKFREFAPRGGENDPTTLSDKMLSGTVEKLVPALASWQGTEDFAPHDRRALEFTARLFSTPEGSTSMADKARMLTLALNDPSTQELAWRHVDALIAEGRDSQPLSVSAFLKEVRGEK